MMQFFPLSLEDYLLGLADLTGELMRFAIAAISRRGGRQKASDVCSFVRACKAGVIAVCASREQRSMRFISQILKD